MPLFSARSAGLRAGFLVAALALCAVAAPRHALAQSAQTIYGFCAAPNCADGMDPAGTPVLDGPNRLYGTTVLGGNGQQGGVAFELSRVSSSAPWRLKIIHSFCAKNDCTDGAQPYAGLILDTGGTGSLFGTTAQGGLGAANADSGSGTVFELRPAKNKLGWKQHVLYRFCARAGCGDGAEPVAALLMDPARNLYGTTSSGGVTTAAGHNEQGGAVFELAYTGANRWSYRVLYSFCAQVGCGDGAGPQGSLVMDGAGNLYGTTYGGGAQNRGTVFELSPHGGPWTEKVLYSFCAQPNCPDGANPAAGLTLDGGGDIIGTSQFGGANGQGTVFALLPNGAAWTERVLYSFCAQPDCTDGAQPMASVIRDGGGNLYGTTAQGGANDLGAAFTLAYNSWRESVLYSFCSNATSSACLDGAETLAGLAMDGAGTLYGVTQTDGGEPGGTVFALTP